MAEPRIETLPDAEALAQRAASWLTSLAEASSDRFAIALSGGSTPKRLYEILAAEPFRDRFPWSRTHLFWGDERLVPGDDKESNQRMVREALLARVSIPPANIHHVSTEGSPAEDAAAYDQVLKNYYGADTLDASRPLFDVVLLGLGENGHTASLFPGTPSLDETLAWVAPVTTGGVPQPRITLTYPAIASSRHVAFLAAGKGKAQILARVLGGDRDQPAARVTSMGELVWFVDEDAARDLPK